ncbi:MAG: hypothetical protein Q9205_006985 [Flavoplaca limonia]
MTSNRNRRIAKEIADIQSDQLSNIKASPAGNGDDITHLKGSFKGPPGTPYEGGTFQIDVRLASDYPFKPPIMKFDTKIWHPNVSSQTGAICLDTLSTGWSPVLTVKSALLSLQSLLSTPEPKDPQDAEVAGMLIRNPKEFERVAQEWAVKYAGAAKRERGEGSGGSGTQTKKQQERRSKADEEAERVAKYHGYNQSMIDNFVGMGFDLERVVSAFEFVGIDHNDGEEYTLEEAYIGDITARLLGEP